MFVNDLNISEIFILFSDTFQSQPSKRLEH
jgi:hypothetical protein